MALPALKLKPLFKERIWGSNNLQKKFQKDLPPGKLIGESWELADLPEDCSTITDGPFDGISLRQMLTDHGRAMGFTQPQCESPFGLLIKFLDAADTLSVQVHPDRQACKMFPQAQLKTECWYVLDAQPQAVIYRGLKPNVSREKLLAAMKTDTLEQLMEVYPARPGDFHYLPAGTIHALGAGTMVAEIQTPSDTTYRLYDWNRRDSQGHSRQLHIEQALASIHFTDTPPTEKNKNSDANCQSPHGKNLIRVAQQLGREKSLLDCPYFHVAHLTLTESKEQSFTSDEPVVMISISAAGAIAPSSTPDIRCSFNPGDTLLIPVLKKGTIQIHKPGQCLLTCLGSLKAS